MQNRNSKNLSRRDVFKLMGAASAVAATTGLWRVGAAESAAAPLKGRIKQGITRGCLRGIKSTEEVVAICARLGIKSMDFVGAGDFPLLKKNGMICSMVMSGSLGKGFNHTENHAASIEGLRKGIDTAAAAGFPNVICFSGNRAGISDEEGLKICAEGLKQIVGYAEKQKITICMELLNSKRNHKDYQCDRTPWGVALCKAVGSPNMKLLYDIYHMQIMEGDVIATLKENLPYIGHIHTAGVPGRNEIDETQELYYPAIMRALVDAGYQGYVTHEYGPKRDPVKSLEEAVRICDV